MTRALVALVALGACTDPMTVRDAKIEIYTAECRRLAACGIDTGLSTEACAEFFVEPQCGKDGCDAEIDFDDDAFSDCVARFQRTSCMTYYTACDVPNDPEWAACHFSDLAGCR